MVWQLDPGIPLVWRTPHSIQLGIDPVLGILDGVTVDHERALALLARGVPRHTLDASGIDATAIEDVLELCAPALVGDGRPVREIVLVGDPELARDVAPSLIAAGLVLVTGLTPDTPAVLVSTHVPDHGRSAALVRRDAPFLPVVVGESGATVGPLVMPGVTSCPRCWHLAAVDEDPAWPAIVTQLMWRPARAQSDPALCAAMAATVVHALDPSAPREVATRIDAETLSSRHIVRAAHPRCGCAGLVAAA